METLYLLLYWYREKTANFSPRFCFLENSSNASSHWFPSGVFYILWMKYGRNYNFWGIQAGSNVCSWISPPISRKVVSFIKKNFEKSLIENDTVVKVICCLLWLKPPAEKMKLFPVTPCTLYIVCFYVQYHTASNCSRVPTSRKYVQKDGTGALCSARANGKLWAEAQ